MHHAPLIQTKHQRYQILKCFPFGTSGKWFLCCGLNFLSRRWKWTSLIALLNNRCTNDKQRVIPWLVIIGSIDFGDPTSKECVAKTWPFIKNSYNCGSHLPQQLGRRFKCWHWNRSQNSATVTEFVFEGHQSSSVAIKVKAVTKMNMAVQRCGWEQCSKDGGADVALLLLMWLLRASTS